MGMDKPCMGCKRRITNKQDGYALSESFWWICKECAASVGIQDGKQARKHDRTSFLEMYSENNPSTSKDLDMIRKVKAAEKAAQKKEQTSFFKRLGAKMKEQDKYVCKSCGNVWYVGDVDHLKNIFNASVGSIYSLNQIKDLGQCPKCGSAAHTKSTVKYWVDKKGNCVDIEE